MSEYKEFSIKLTEQSKVVQTLFIRQHRVRDINEKKPSDRTLFVAGVPPYMHEESLKLLFSRFGDIESVFLQKTLSSKQPRTQTFDKEKISIGYKVAYVVFKNSTGLDRALENKTQGIVKPSSLLTGVKKWSEEYNKGIPPDGTLQQDIEKYMNSFDNQEEIKKKKEKDAAEPDDEGWVTVTKRGKKPGFARKESVLKKISETMKKKKERKELSTFYRFQIKESKMKNLVSLRQKFEEDKKRIAALKATRRFKPF